MFGCDIIVNMKRVAVVVACKGEESDAFFDRWGEGEFHGGGYDVFRYEGTEERPEVFMMITGAGLIDAAGGTQYIIDRFSPDVVIKVGLVSGATKREELGKTYLVDGAIDASYNISVFGNLPGQHTGSGSVEWGDKELTKKLAKRLGMEVRLGATTNYFIKSASQEKELGDGMNKSELKKLYPEVGVFDMENAAVARVCSRNNVPCVIIVGVSDDYRSDAETYVKMAPKVSKNGLMPTLTMVLNEISKMK